MMFDYKGGRGLKNLGKSDYVIYEPPLTPSLEQKQGTIIRSCLSSCSKSKSFDLFKF